MPNQTAGCLKKCAQPIRDHATLIDRRNTVTPDGNVDPLAVSARCQTQAGHARRGERERVRCSGRVHECHVWQLALTQKVALWIDEHELAIVLDAPRAELRDP